MPHHALSCFIFSKRSPGYGSLLGFLVFFFWFRKCLTMHHHASYSSLNLAASSPSPPPPPYSSSPVSARRRWSWLGRGLPCLAIAALLLALIFLFGQFSGLELPMDSPHLTDSAMAKQQMKNSSADSSPPPKQKMKKSSSDSSPPPKQAICLVGGAREFEITGPSIRKYLLHQGRLNHLPHVDVFLHAPLDKDTYKLSILAGRDLPISFIHFRIIKPEPILESKTYTDVLTGSGSPRGVQVNRLQKKLSSTHTFIDTCMHSSTHTHTHTHTHVCMFCVHVCVTYVYYTCVSVCVCMYEHVCSCIMYVFLRMYEWA